MPNIKMQIVAVEGESTRLIKDEHVSVVPRVGDTLQTNSDNFHKVDKVVWVYHDRSVIDNEQVNVYVTTENQ